MFGVFKKDYQKEAILNSALEMTPGTELQFNLVHHGAVLGKMTISRSHEGHFRASIIKAENLTKTQEEFLQSMQTALKLLAA